jgi:hypothetical protein
MPAQRQVAAAALAAIALALAACGGSVAVQPTAKPGATAPASRGRIDNAATQNPNHLACLRRDHLPVTEVSPRVLQVGSPPAGPTIVFTPTPGYAQGQQITGRAQTAEVIGSALVYVNHASDGELRTIENCLSVGVTG